MQRGDSKVIISIVGRRNHYLLKYKHCILIDTGKCDRKERKKNVMLIFVCVCLYESCFLYREVFKEQMGLVI